MDKEEYAHFLDRSWLEFRQQLLEVYPLLDAGSSSKESLSNSGFYSSQDSSAPSALGSPQAAMPLAEKTRSRKTSLKSLKSIDHSSTLRSEWDGDASQAVGQHHGDSEKLLGDGLKDVKAAEAKKIRSRLRLRLGAISGSTLVTGKSLLDSITTLGLTKYEEHDMNDMVNHLADFIGLWFEPDPAKPKPARHSSRSIDTIFQTNADLKSLGRPRWQWPGSQETPGPGNSVTANIPFADTHPVRMYNAVPAQALMDVFLSDEAEMLKRIFGPRLMNQFLAIQEILLAGDTNRLVAELTFVRINDLAAPPDPTHPLVYMEPLVAVLIVGNGIMIGLQTDPKYQDGAAEVWIPSLGATFLVLRLQSWRVAHKMAAFSLCGFPDHCFEGSSRACCLPKDWGGWAYVELAFQACLFLEILLRVHLLGCKDYWCGTDVYWNCFDLFLFTSGLADLLLQFLGGQQSDMAATSLLRFCRLIRLVRIVKVFRIKFMRDLRLMVKGLIAGIRTLALAFVLLFAVLYVISGFAAMTIGSDARTAEIGLTPFFYNIPESMFTAFRCFTGECVNDEGQPIHSLLAREFGLPFIGGYVASYMLVSMGIFNVILAVYVDITMKAAKETDAVTAEQYSRESIRIARTTRELLKKFSSAYNLFNDMEDNSKNSTAGRLELSKTSMFQETEMDKIAITKELFLLIIQDRRVQQLMDELDLPPDRANLFEIIDADASGTLQITELLHGLLKIRGEINKSDAVASLLATRAVQHLLNEFMQESTRKMEELRAEMRELVHVRQFQPPLFSSLQKTHQIQKVVSPSLANIELPLAARKPASRPTVTFETRPEEEVLSQRPIMQIEKPQKPFVCEDEDAVFPTWSLPAKLDAT